MGLVRLRAAEWHIDPHKIGVLGFSASGYLVAEISTRYEHRLYAAVDAGDKVSARPDFAVAVYPGHLWVDGKGYKLNRNAFVCRGRACLWATLDESAHQRLARARVKMAANHRRAQPREWL